MSEGAADRKRILFLASQLPHPAQSGATIKTASILDYLRERHDVHLVCLRQDELTPEQREWAKQFSGFESFELRRGRNPLYLARSYLARVPLSIERNRSRAMQDLVDRVMSDNEFDVVFVDGWLMAQYLTDEFAGTKLLHEHNAEYVLWQRQADLERSPLRRGIVRGEARRVQKHEAELALRFDTIFAVSDADRDALISIGVAGGKLRVLPNLPEQSLLEGQPLSFVKAEPLVMYLGTLSWQPNIEGIEHFLREVWPLVHRQRNEARLVIAGQGASRRLRRLAGKEKGVELAGEVADPEPLYRRARVFVEATRSGGGTKVKVLNALARGLPVVASPQAIEGLDIAPDEHLFVAERPPAMAAAVVRLLTDATIWQRLSDAGRSLIRERYTPDTAFGVLDEALGMSRAAV